MFKSAYLEDIRRQFQICRDLAEKSIARVTDNQFIELDCPNGNSIALIVKHMAGNMKSRWTDFLTTDGEKDDRHRDTEFEIIEGDDRQSLLERWNDGWEVVFDAVDTASEVSLDAVIKIRGEEHSLVGAFNRQLTHYAYHAGQIVMLARRFAGDRWESLSIPKGESSQFNMSMRTKHLGGSGEGGQ